MCTRYEMGLMYYNSRVRAINYTQVALSTIVPLVFWLPNQPSTHRSAARRHQHVNLSFQPPSRWAFACRIFSGAEQSAPLLGRG
jgi:hypothetical protein